VGVGVLGGEEGGELGVVCGGGVCGVVGWGHGGGDGFFFSALFGWVGVVLNYSRAVCSEVLKWSVRKYVLMYDDVREVGCSYSCGRRQY